MEKTTRTWVNVIAITIYCHTQQERYQLLQEYRDQFVAYRKVCEQLGIKLAHQKMVVTIY